MLDSKNLQYLSGLVHVVAGIATALNLTALVFLLHQWRTAPPSRPFTNPAERLLTFLLSTTLVGSLGMFIGRWGPESGSALCNIQGAFIEFGLFGSVVWMFAFAWDLFTLVRVSRYGEQLEKDSLVKRLLQREAIFVPLAYILSLMMAILPAFLPHDDEPTLYGDANLWCFVHNSPSNVLGFLYFWMWLALIVSFFIVVYATIDWRRNQLDWEVNFDDVRPGCFRAISFCLIGYIIIWLGSSLNRFYKFANNQDSLALNYVQATAGCLVGVVPAAIWFVLWYNGEFPRLPVAGKTDINDMNGWKC